jgi:hypothetical protein
MREREKKEREREKERGREKESSEVINEIEDNEETVRSTILYILEAYLRN